MILLQKGRKINKYSQKISVKNKRTKVGQKRHDEGVKRSADWYKNKGFGIKVDLPGEEKPKKINGFIPDIIATKGKKEIVIEVETKQTANTDKEQQGAFRNYANKKPGRIFRKKII